MRRRRKAGGRQTLKVVLKNGMAAKWKDEEFDDYKYDRNCVFIIKENKFVGVYNMDDVMYIAEKDEIEEENGRKTMTSKEAIKIIKNLTVFQQDENAQEVQALSKAITALKETEWIPFEIENEVFVCKTASDDEEILVSDSTGVWQDTWVCTCDKFGNALEGLGSNIEIAGLAWRPMPAPWREEQ